MAGPSLGILLALLLLLLGAHGCPKVVVVYLPTTSQINASTDPSNKYGLENGIVVRRQDQRFSMITAEMYGDPVNVAMRLGIWSSPDGMTWTKQRVIRQSSADMTGSDPRSSVWGPFFTQDMQTGVWVLSYVGYRGAPSNASGWLSNYHGIIFQRAATARDDAGLDSDFGDSGDWRNADTVLFSPDDFSVCGPWPHPCQGLQGTDSMYAYELSDGTWAALVGTSHQETPDPWPIPGGGKWPVSHATAPSLSGPWTRTNPHGPPADAPCINITDGSTENPIVSRRPDDIDAFHAVYDDIFGEAEGFGYACSATGGMDWERGIRVPVPGGCRTPYGLLPMNIPEIARWTPGIVAYGVINASRITAPDTQLFWLFYTLRQGQWDVFRSAIVQLSW